jgi:tetratricopeptide (TPR) repeat protein
MKAAAQALAARPDDPELLAWHGAAVLAWARVANLDIPSRIQSFQTATTAMDKAVAAAPDNPRVRMARGVILQIETPTMPRFANYPGLVENARSDFQRLFDLRKGELDRLGTHRLGELLQGLADLYSRQGKVEDAERYYRMIGSMLPNTEYAARAAQWLATKQPLPTAQTTCIGCHASP